AQRRRCHMDADARTSASTAAAAFSALVADSRDGSAAENDTALVSSASTDRGSALRGVARLTRRAYSAAVSHRLFGWPATASRSVASVHASRTRAPGVTAADRRRWRRRRWATGAAPSSAPTRSSTNAATRTRRHSAPACECAGFFAGSVVVVVVGAGAGTSLVCGAVVGVVAATLTSGGGVTPV